MSDRLFSDEVRRVEEVRRRIITIWSRCWACRSPSKLVEPKSIERKPGKARRVLDKRELK
jgi:phenylacetate-CoA ligase